MKETQQPHGYRRAHTIEFMGGPFDGHADVIRDHDELTNELWWLVNANVFWLLDGKPHGPRQPITSVALYELQEREDERYYFFSGAVSLETLLAAKEDGGTLGE